MQCNEPCKVTAHAYYQMDKNLCVACQERDFQKIKNDWKEITMYERKCAGCDKILRKTEAQLKEKHYYYSVYRCDHCQISP